MNSAAISYTARITGFFSHRWSLSTVFYVATAVGLASPLLNILFYRTLPFEAAHHVCLSIGVILLGLFYWRMERGQSRRNRAAMVSMVGASVLWGFGVLGSGWCYSHHTCMSGHMEHPPYEWWDYGFDVGWVLCLDMAALWTRLFRAWLCITFAALSAFLISYRFLFGSLGGMYEGLPL